jgi:putative ABC transport system permease protein
MRFITELFEGFKLALQALKANKLRTFLTILGIVIGMATVIGIHSIIQGLNEAFYSSISALGSDILYVQKFAWFDHQDWIESRNRKNIGEKEAEAIQKYATLVKAVSQTSSAQRSVKFENKSLADVYILGASAAYQITSNIIPELGRFYSEQEAEHRRAVCVIGWEVADRLFKKLNPIGRRVSIAGHKFTVVGVNEKQGSLFGFNMDSQVIMPLGIFQKIFGSRRWITIEAKVLSPQLLEDAKDELTGILRRVRKVEPGAKNDFALNQQNMFAEMYQNLTRALYFVAFFIGFIALLVGGIGIMNILLVSVTERTREIGIRKAIGAKKSDILWQFLVESVVVTALGGIIGIITGFAFAKLVASMTILAATVSPVSIIIGLIFIALFGLFFGIYPAYKAAKLDPIEALRYE